MKVIKTSTFTVSLFGSISIFAGSMGSCNKGDVSLPCVEKNWQLGAYALYLKPQFTGSLAFLAAVNEATANQPESYIPNSLETGWGFKLDARYNYGPGSDVVVNWYHALNNTTQRTYTSSGTTAILFTETAVAQTTVQPSWNAVNLEVGQNTNFGPFKQIRFHGGLQYARISLKAKKLAATAIGGSFGDLGTYVDYSNTTTLYNGVGVRGGIDLGYEIYQSFSLNANFAATALYGRSKLDRTVLEPQGTLDFPSSTRGSSNSVVPVLETKISAKYNTALFKGDLDLEVGWMVNNYFNALLYNAEGQRLNSFANFSVEGLLFGGSWRGNLI